MWWNHMDGGDWWWMTLTMVAFWGLVIWFVVYLVRSTDHTRNDDGRPDPERLLAERFARGEIDEAEYRRALDILHEGRGSRAGRS